MLLESYRVFLRPILPSDASVLFRLHTDPLVVKLIMDGRAPTRAESDARLDLYLRDWDRLGYGFWMVYEKQPGGDLHFAGRCGLRDFDGADRELGYCFLERASGRGLATEASRIVIEAAFSRLGLTKLIAVVRPANIRSQRVMDKLGFCSRGMRVHRGASFRFYELHPRLMQEG
ncbi:GNAT family N-acetyltransferase [Nitratireductor luteus]|uniref:GNAT family N-acetyltransferase n=1 Tax=Nitratireductor luteus TaxID=2976980 RepID=UPI00223F3213|nr:GNAT family N-acetyltransferase [Nitratireductor luteus]